MSDDRTARPDINAVIDEAVQRAIEFARPEYLDRKQMAKELGITVETLREMEARGLPGHQLGPRTHRFVRAEVDAWIRSQGTA